MSLIRKHARLLVVAVCCLAVGAGASAIAGAGATTPSRHVTQSHHAPGSRAHRPGAHRLGAHRLGGRLRLLARRAVEGSAVVRTATGFATVSFERGVVNSVSGQQLTLTEGTPKAAYKTVTLTIPTSAVVRDDRRTASLSSLKAGQRVVVVQAPKRTLVVARTP